MLFLCRGDLGCSWLQISPAASPSHPLQALLSVPCLLEGWVQQERPSSFGLFLQQHCAELQVIESVKPGCSHPCSLLIPHIPPGLALGPSRATAPAQEHLHAAKGAATSASTSQDLPVL